MDQKIINLYDEYTHKPLPRSVFLKKLVALTGSLAAAMSVLPLLEGCYSKAATSAGDDLLTERITYPGAGGEMKALLARPRKDGRYAGVIVIHENRGLSPPPHIEDVTLRVARAGYLALGVDALSPFGGTPANEDEGRTLIGKLDAAQNLRNYIKAYDYLATRRDCNGRFGCVGFCWGGALANQLAVNDPRVKAAVAYYGRQPETADVPKIKGAVQLHYGELDERINAGIPAYEAALKAAGVPYELFIYPGTNHAFHNDTSAARYNEAAAKLSWQRTLAFFDKYLD